MLCNLKFDSDAICFRPEFSSVWWVFRAETTLAARYKEKGDKYMGKIFSSFGKKAETAKEKIERKESFSGTTVGIFSIRADATVMPADQDEITILISGPRDAVKRVLVEEEEGIVNIYGTGDTIVATSKHRTVKSSLKNCVFHGDFVGGDYFVNGRKASGSNIVIYGPSG